jgi:hypothetical protein
MPQSAIVGSNLDLKQNAIYRARLRITAMLAALATESMVADKLKEAGFVDVKFYDKDALPPDWPSSETESVGTTKFLEGRFEPSDRKVPLSSLGDQAELLGMWLYRDRPGAALPVKNGDSKFWVLGPDGLLHTMVTFETTAPSGFQAWAMPAAPGDVGPRVYVGEHPPPEAAPMPATGASWVAEQNSRGFLTVVDRTLLDAGKGIYLSAVSNLVAAQIAAGADAPYALTTAPPPGTALPVPDKSKPPPSTITVGKIAAGVAILAGGWWLWRRRKRNRGG